MEREVAGCRILTTFYLLNSLQLHENLFIIFTSLNKLKSRYYEEDHHSYYR